MTYKTTEIHPDDNARMGAVDRPVIVDSFPVVVIGASAGGIIALSTILAALPERFSAAIAIVQHRSSKPGLLAEVISRQSGRSVRDATEGDRLIPGSIFLAPAGRHLLINADASLSLADTPKVHFSRPSVDRLFESAAENLKGRIIAVVLTGGDGDGQDGVQAVKRWGGCVIAQDRATSKTPSMPESAIETGCVDLVLPLDEIAPMIARLLLQGAS